MSTASTRIAIVDGEKVVEEGKSWSLVQALQMQFGMQEILPRSEDRQAVRRSEKQLQD